MGRLLHRSDFSEDGIVGGIDRFDFHVQMDALITKQFTVSEKNQLACKANIIKFNNHWSGRSNFDWDS
jgi:hypothetical protein